MKIEKYEALGNDFIIVENQQDVDYQELTKKLSDRHLSFGADGLIVFDSKKQSVNFFNADGSEAKVCGNGLRCLQKYLSRHHISLKNDSVIALDGTHMLTENNNFINVTFPLNLPLTVVREKWKIDNSEYDAYLIDVGNPHAVLISSVDENKYHYFEKIGIEKDLNINFVEIISQEEIKVKTIERGVGLTFSCGSGSLAAAIVLFQLNLIQPIVDVNHPYGTLRVVLDREVTISSKASFVYESEVDL